jgi:myo-inositol-1(or 4)-monophosphatase
VTTSEAELVRRRLVAEEAVRAAAAVHRRYWRMSIEYSIKEGNRRDLVTIADTESQVAAQAVIESAFPGETIIGEEDLAGMDYQREALGQAAWVIDPLDGTFMFVHGFPDFSATVAYVERGLPLAGAVYAPVTEELFSAARGLGATLNGSAISVSARRGLEQAVVNVYFGEVDDETFGALTAKVRRSTLSQRSFGGTAIVLAYLASGRYDAFYVADNYRMGPWDLAAGALLIEEAGGFVTMADGSPFSLPTTSIAAAADAVTLTELCDLIRT